MVRRRAKKAASVQVKAVAYLRASKNEQRNTPHVQRQAIEAWASVAGVRIVGWHLDHGITGAAPVADRPSLLAALEQVKADGAALLVVAKRDRLTRDPIVGAVIEKMAKDIKAQVVSAAGEGNGDTPGDRFMRRVIDASSEYERELIRARTKATLQTKKTRGERLGSIPYGWKVRADDQHVVRGGVRRCKVGPDGKSTCTGCLNLEMCEAEQAIIRRAKELSDEEKPLRAITAKLNEEGHRNRAGKPFAFQSVYNFLLPLLDEKKDDDAA